MANPHVLRNCPTRTDGADALFAHKVTQGVCQDRQRNRYHKCFTCGFNNARVALHGLPTPKTAPQAAAELEPEVEQPSAAPALMPGFVEIA